MDLGVFNVFYILGLAIVCVCIGVKNGTDIITFYTRNSYLGGFSDGDDNNHIRR